MNAPTSNSRSFAAQTLQFGSKQLVVLEGEVIETQRWQESSVQSRRHLGGGVSIGTAIERKGEFWLREDDGQEVSVRGSGGLQMRPGHRLRVLTHGERGDLRAVAVRNLSTGVEQWDEAEAASARDSVLASLIQTLLALALVGLLLLGLLLWAFSKHSGAGYLLPALVPLGLAIALHNGRRNRFRRFVEVAMQ